MPKHNQLQYLLHIMLGCMWQNKYGYQFVYIYVKIFDWQTLEIYVHTSATYEVTGISPMTSSAIHRQNGNGTWKTGNLDVGFSRQGKHREFSYNTGMFDNTGKKLEFSIPIFWDFALKIWILILYLLFLAFYVAVFGVFKGFLGRLYISFVSGVGLSAYNAPSYGCREMSQGHLVIPRSDRS